MSHNHHHKHSKAGSALLWSTVLNFSVAIVQLIGGFISNSLSLVSDAVHNLGDASAIFGAFVANRIGQRDPSKTRTYGYKRAEIIAAFINALVLITISIYLTVEAISRFNSPEEINSRLMLIVAIAGLLVNVLSVFLLQGKQKGNLNVRAAYLHLLSDTFSSVAVILGAIAMLLWDIFWLDPVLTLLVNLLILRHTWSVLKESVNVLMQGVPEHLNLSGIKSEIEKNKEVLHAHHMHIWTLDGNKIFFDCHIEFMHDLSLTQTKFILDEIAILLENKFHIHHATLQAEFESDHANEELEEKCV